MDNPFNAKHATIRLHTPGIRRIPRADRTAVAAKPICAALAAMGCSIALLRNSRRLRDRADQ
jgi:hypothetical protein